MTPVPPVGESEVRRLHSSDGSTVARDWKRRVPERRTIRWSRVRLFMRRVSPAAFVLLATGCAHWEQRRLDQPTPIKADLPVWIWTGRTIEKWHAVVITQDAVSGIPYETSLKCDSCRRSIPRAQVDSMKLGYNTGGAKETARVVAVTSLVLAGALAIGVILEAVLCPAFGSPKGC